MIIFTTITIIITIINIPKSAATTIQKAVTVIMPLTTMTTVQQPQQEETEAGAEAEGAGAGAGEGGVMVE